MWLVHLALKRPYTFVCASILILIFGIVAIVSMPIDIFPAINIPVVSVLWQYGGLSPKEMEQRVVTLAERVYSSYVNDIEHVESQSLAGLSVIKVYFQPDANVEAGMAQITAASQGVTHNMPPGISPPFMTGSTPLTCRSCSSASRVRNGPRRSWAISRRTSSACRSPPCTARRCRRPTAVCRGW